MPESETQMRKLVFISLLILGLILPASAMSNNRIIEIQKALTKIGYTVRITGRMDNQTVQALKKFQKDNHWQHKVVPDSRALINLGLGPKYKGLLNPETAWVAKADYGKNTIIQHD